MNECADLTLAGRLFQARAAATGYVLVASETLGISCDTVGESHRISFLKLSGNREIASASA